MKFLAALASALVVAALGVAPPALASTDGDGDSIDDSLEDTLAARFFPWVWYDSGENAGCTNPASTAGNPGTALARVRPHPADPGKIAIQYVILYQRDCGDFGGFSAHAGDVEPFSVTLAANPACPDGYGAFSLKTVAHEGQMGEHVDQRLLGNSCTWGRFAGGSPYVARIYASENKHGNYASDASCDSSLGGLENCSESFTLPFNVFNVGEDDARRIDELSGYQFPGEFAWTDVPFRGGLGNGLGDAGTVRAKLLNDGLLAIGYNPPPSTRCSQPAHAWYQTPSRDQYIRQGQLLLVIAAGVMPNTVAQFKFYRDGQEVATYQTRWANNNCVINQEYVAIWLAPARYQVIAFVEEPVSIGGTLTKAIGQPDLIVT
ncbi:MAG TPA: hypothetical protein VFC19_35280 [Candidatus Limnocylindrales bacterium]|nr:hypothetical protein [Candidatus Limnocylindrales bacterium]